MQPVAFLRKAKRALRKKKKDEFYEERKGGEFVGLLGTVELYRN